VFGPGNQFNPGGDPGEEQHSPPLGFEEQLRDNAYSAEIPECPQGAAPAMMTFQETKALIAKGNDQRQDLIMKCEWANFKDWISADIRQIVIQTHVVPHRSSVRRPVKTTNAGC
jgi:hypothetical protein